MPAEMSWEMVAAITGIIGTLFGSCATLMVLAYRQGGLQSDVATNEKDINAITDHVDKRYEQLRDYVRKRINTVEEQVQAVHDDNHDGNDGCGDPQCPICYSEPPDPPIFDGSPWPGDTAPPRSGYSGTSRWTVDDENDDSEE